MPNIFELTMFRCSTSELRFSTKCRFPLQFQLFKCNCTDWAVFNRFNSLHSAFNIFLVSSESDISIFKIIRYLCLSINRTTLQPPRERCLLRKWAAFVAFYRHYRGFWLSLLIRKKNGLAFSELIRKKRTVWKANMMDPRATHTSIYYHPWVPLPFINTVPLGFLNVEKRVKSGFGYPQLRRRHIAPG